LLSFLGNFNAIIALYTDSGHLDAPLRAEAIVTKFRGLLMQGKLPGYVKPDAYMYSQLIKVWVESGHDDGIKKAVAFFSWMKELSKAGDKAAAPDVFTYSTIINAYACRGDY
jgi:hypothetical protein